MLTVQSSLVNWVDHQLTRWCNLLTCKGQGSEVTDFKDGGRGKHVGSPVTVSKYEIIVLQMSLFLVTCSKGKINMVCTCCAIS